MTATVAGEAEEIIGTSEAAAALGCTTREVRRKADAGTLRGWREEQDSGLVEWRFRRTDVEAYKQQRREDRSRKAASRTDALAVREIISAQDRATAAAEALAAVSKTLAERMSENTEAHHQATTRIGELLEIIGQQQEEIAKLRQALEAERQDRKRSWLDRLLRRDRTDEAH